MSRDVIADALGFAPNSIQTKLSSCVQYGLLELKDGEGYKPSDLFMDLYKPMGHFELLVARYECFKNPKVYEAIIEDFNYSQLPAKEKLAIILFRNYEISETAAERAAEVFIRNAELLGFLTNDGVLQVNHPGEELASKVKLTVSDLNGVVYSKVLNGPPKIDESGLTKTASLYAKDEGPTHNPPLTINLKSGRTVLIKFPKNVTTDEIDRTIKFLEFYREGLE